MENDCWTRIAAEAPGLRPFEVFNMPIDKLAHDEKEYKIIRLENGLEAVLVHDPKADAVAASMTVNVGRMDEPDDMQMVSTLLCRVLAWHGSLSNGRGTWCNWPANKPHDVIAHTFPDKTRFKVQDDTNNLDAMLSKLSACFMPHSFSERVVSDAIRYPGYPQVPSENPFESRAVKVCREVSHSRRWENARYNCNFEWLLIDTYEEMVYQEGVEPNRNSCWKRVLEVLEGPAPERLARKMEVWWKEIYSAHKMHLCVVSPDPLDTISQLVVEKFSSIPVLDGPAMVAEPLHPIGPEDLGSMLVMKTDDPDRPTIDFQFPMPREVNAPWKRDHFIAFMRLLLQDGRPGSLKALLTREYPVIDLKVVDLEMPWPHKTLSIQLVLLKDALSYSEQYLRGNADSPGPAQLLVQMLSEVVQGFLDMLRSSEIEQWRLDDFYKMQILFADAKMRNKPIRVAEALSAQLYDAKKTSSPLQFITSHGWNGQRLTIDDIRKHLDLLSLHNCRTVVEDPKLFTRSPNWERQPSLSPMSRSIRTQRVYFIERRQNAGTFKVPKTLTGLYTWAASALHFPLWPSLPGHNEFLDDLSPPFTVENEKPEVEITFHSKPHIAGDDGFDTVVPNLFAAIFNHYLLQKLDAAIQMGAASQVKEKDTKPDDNSYWSMISARKNTIKPLYAHCQEGGKLYISGWTLSLPRLVKECCDALKSFEADVEQLYYMEAQWRVTHDHVSELSSLRYRCRNELCGIPGTPLGSDARIWLKPQLAKLNSYHASFLSEMAASTINVTGLEDVQIEGLREVAERTLGRPVLTPERYLARAQGTIQVAA